MMRRLAPMIGLVLALVAPSGSAAAREPVDPGTLNPPPPDFFNAACARTGGHILCTLAFSDPEEVDVPTGLFCDGAEILDSWQRSVVGKRTYDADGNLTRRHFRESLDGMFENPATGGVLLYHGHDTVFHDVTVPGDLDSGDTRFSGQYVRFFTPDGATVLTDVGTFVEAGGELVFASGHHPLFDLGTDPAVLATICEALAGD